MRPNSTPGSYAGIGSRATPADVLDLMTIIATRLADDRWTLRTGGACGADEAFLEGAGSGGNGTVELYLPWPGFQSRSEARLTRPTREAFEVAAHHHPAWSSCSEAARSLHARNSHQVLGAALTDPADFVVCFTPDGSLAGDTRASGGTGQALRIASANGIPVFNLQRTEHRQRIEDWLTAP
jgi:hypothetical protein